MDRGTEIDQRHRYEIENIRRSLAMLTPGQPSGLSRERAIDVLEKLQDVQARLDRLRTELKRLADDG
jgi:hypothetical protein